MKNTPISANLEDNLGIIRDVIGRNADVVIREFRFQAGRERRAAVVYLDDQIDELTLNQNILRPLMLDLPGIYQDIGAKGPGSLVRFLAAKVLAVSNVKIHENIYQAVMAALAGEVTLLVDGERQSLAADIKMVPRRAVPETETENVVRGPKQAFGESVAVNTAMVRNLICEPNLVIEAMSIGTVTRTPVALAYIKGLVQPELVTEVKSRLDRIEIDGVLEGIYLEELIKDNAYSPFPQLGTTERPDRVVSFLLEGRVVIFINGTPLVLWLPVRLGDLLQAPEDHYQFFIFATTMRWLRYIALVISLTLPSLYVAVITFHQEMIPPGLMFSIVAARQGVPFPALVEALIMEITFEALREAGIRLPRAVGQAISIVGALVIGQAAVAAGIVSPLMVIVVAITGIASFMMPNYDLGLAIRQLRFPLVLISGALGLFGLMTGVLLILIHLLSLRSFGVPYLSPLAPLELPELKDTLVRAPRWAITNRPGEMVKNNYRRVRPALKPEPPRRGKG